MPLFSTRLTATVSVALVLLLLGVAACLGVATRNVANDIRSGIGFVVIMDDDATGVDIGALKQRFTKAPYVASYTYSSPEQVMQRWQQMMGDDENFTELLDTNPFAPEIEVCVKAPWANSDSLKLIISAIEMMPAVAEVNGHDNMVDEVNSTINNITIVLLSIAATMLIISFVLINNTVRLTVYSRRFSIYTMKLVGATPGFIRAPLVKANTLAGFIAGIAASAILTGVIFWAGTADQTISVLAGWDDVIPVLASLPVAGMIICLPAAWFAANRYLRLSHDEMFK